jgi:putative tricarboxylic transport membrane protein
VNKNQTMNIAAGAIFLVYGTLMLYGGISITAVPKPGDVGSAFMPRLCGGLIIFLSILLLCVTFFGKGSKPERKTETGAPFNRRSIVFSVLLLIIYMAALIPLGFILSSTIYLVLQMLLMANQPEKKHVILYIFISLVTPLLVNYIFYSMFALMLPAGILG